MLRRSQPRLPVDAVERAWTDRGLAELAGMFGPASRWPTILPTPEYFPATFDGSEAAVRSLLDRVCGWMGADSAELDLELFADDADSSYDDAPTGVLTSMRTVAGDYRQRPGGRGLIGINRGDLSSPLTLVATIAHEICHHLLITHHHVDPERKDGEGLTDLATIHLGTGIITANAQRQNRTSYTGGWSSTTLGYLSGQTIGYALARRALDLGQPDPDWASYLASGPRGHLKASLKSLLATRHTP